MKVSGWKKVAFIVVVCMFAGGTLCAQARQEFKIAGKSYIQLKKGLQPSLPIFSMPSNDLQFYRFVNPTQESILHKQPQNVPKAYAYDELGFFCKWEVKMEKAAKIPVKFRLGEVQYVERMEGKLPPTY